MNLVGRITSVLLLLMILNVFHDVIRRHFFRNSAVGMQEMEWYLFSIIIQVAVLASIVIFPKFYGL